MKTIFNFFVDKLLRLFLFFEFSSKKDEGYIYQRDFLGKENYSKDLAEIFKPVTEAVNNDFEKIYSVKESLYNEAVFQKIKYCIDNKLWGLFAFTLSDGYQIDNEDYFNQPSLRVYLIVKANKEKNIVVVKSKVKHFEILALYPKIKVAINSFKDKNLVYSREGDFTSI